MPEIHCLTHGMANKKRSKKADSDEDSFLDDDDSLDSESVDDTDSDSSGKDRRSVS